MKLVVGLGNPETKYNSTRHNVGFSMLDIFADEIGAKWQHKDKFKAFVAELPDKSALLIKPTTYYNLVGESVQSLASFYKITPENILVVHDELALPFGTIRTREKGSDAGNNGMKSINQHLGDTTKRLRIGTKNKLSEYMDSADFVLSKFTPAERKTVLKSIYPHAKIYIENFLDDKFESTKVSANLDS